MRKLFVAGNWKMNLDLDSCCKLAEALKSQAGNVDDVTLAVCPSFVYLNAVADILRGSTIAVGGQNMCAEPEGAFTGDISGAMLRDVGCQYVILGHSERRHVFGETDKLINRKVHRALDEGLKPILCVGETLEQREAGNTQQVVSRQVESGLEDVGKGQMKDITVAYEPVWAIGTGKTASPEQADEVHAMIRELVEGLFDGETAQNLVIQYGGSVKPKNAADLLSCENVDGALVGGASLKADTFVPIIETAQSME